MSNGEVLQKGYEFWKFIHFMFKLKYCITKRKHTVKYTAAAELNFDYMLLYTDFTHKHWTHTVVHGHIIIGMWSKKTHTHIQSYMRII
jgi:hypothetical protein